MAHIPANPRSARLWELTQIYRYSVSSEPQQRGKAASFKEVNDHEGLAVGDVDGDGKQDIVAGGRWFRNLGDVHFETHTVDAGCTFSSAGVGHIITGSRKEQPVPVIGDGEGPLFWYEGRGDSWTAPILRQRSICLWSTGWATSGRTSWRKAWTVTNRKLPTWMGMERSIC